jgi:probable addiction module antidote protein
MVGNMATAVAFDVVDYLDNPEMIAAYLTEAFETADAEFIAKAIGAVARAQGTTDGANESPTATHAR